MRLFRWSGLLLVACLLSPAAARADLGQAAGPAALCDAAIAGVERAQGLPPRLLGAIGRVESGRRDPATGIVTPWPWTIDVEGTGHLYGSAAEAIAAVRAARAAGHSSIDVGCMQVNLAQHPDAFADLAAAFDPATNAAYAARFLGQLRSGAADWMTAAGLYHSATPGLAAAYRVKVAAMMQDGSAGADGEALPLVQAGTGMALPLGAVSARLASGLAMPIPAMAMGPTGGSLAAAGLRGMVLRTAAQLAAPPMAGAGGRGLAAYRAMPVRLAQHS